MEREMGQRPYQRHSFILTLWTEGDAQPDAPPVWRYSLEDPLSSQRYGYKDLAELTRFLEEWAAVPLSEEPADEKTDAKRRT